MPPGLLARVGCARSMGGDEDGEGEQVRQPRTPVPNGRRPGYRACQNPPALARRGLLPGRASAGSHAGGVGTIAPPSPRKFRARAWALLVGSRGARPARRRNATTAGKGGKRRLAGRQPLTHEMGAGFRFRGKQQQPRHPRLRDVREREKQRCRLPRTCSVATRDQGPRQLIPNLDKERDENPDKQARYLGPLPEPLL